MSGGHGHTHGHDHGVAAAEGRRHPATVSAAAGIAGHRRLSLLDDTVWTSSAIPAATLSDYVRGAYMITATPTRHTSAPMTS